MQYAGTKRQVRRHVKPEATVITDELSSYKGLDAHYEHLVINHAETYLRGQVHTNGIENFWSLVKRSLGGTCISVEPFHLFRLSQCFRGSLGTSRWDHSSCSGRLANPWRFALRPSLLSGRL